MRLQRTLAAGDNQEPNMLVQKLRLQRGWSQQQLAELSGLSVRTIQRVENGHLPSMETLKSLASVFEIEFSQLSSENADMNSNSATANSNASANPSPDLREREEKLAFKHVRKVKAFYLHVVRYVFVLAGLALLNWFSSPHYWWVVWVALGWGIGLLAHAARTFAFLPFFGADWEKRQVEKRLGRPL